MQFCVGDSKPLRRSTESAYAAQSAHKAPKQKSLESPEGKSVIHQPVPLWLPVAIFIVAAGVALPVVAKARATRTERESQRQLDAFELGMRVEAMCVHS